MRRTPRTSRQLRCSGIFSAVWLAGPLASVPGLSGIVLALPRSPGCSSRCPARLPVGVSWCFHKWSALDVSFQRDIRSWALLGSECHAVHAGRPHGTPAPLPAFLPGRAHQGCPPSRPATLPPPAATAPKVLFWRRRLQLVREVLGEVPCGWVILRTSGSGTRRRGVSAGHLVWLCVQFLCALNTWSCEMRSRRRTATVDAPWYKHDVNFFHQRCLLQLIKGQQSWAKQGQSKYRAKGL